MRIVRLPDTGNAHSSGESDPIVGVAIGNFDGCHLGHEALITELERETARVAAEGGGNPIKTVLTFSPHPRIGLQIAKGQLSLTQLREHSELWPIFPFRERVTQISERGIDRLFIARFSKAFASLSPEQFVSLYLHDALKARVVVVGDDWRFGKGRAGNVELLQDYGKRFGFEVHVVPPVLLDGKRVSSTTIKASLAIGDIVSVSRLLGRSYELAGRVVHGAGRGKSISVPTANLMLGRRVLPLDGVYVSRVVLGGELLPAVTNIGTQPTFNGATRRVEVHILDRELKLYDKRISVQLIDRIRGEKKFADVQQLKNQIAEDILKARDVLRHK